MAPHWKCGSGQPVAGSNPALSAISARRDRGPWLRCRLCSSLTHLGVRSLRCSAPPSPHSRWRRAAGASVGRQAGENRVSFLSRARRGTSGALYLQSATAGLNPLPRSPFSNAARRRDVEDRVPRSGEPRTVSDPEGSSTKRSSSGAAERPGPSRSSRWARVTSRSTEGARQSISFAPDYRGGRDVDRPAPGALSALARPDIRGDRRPGGRRRDPAQRRPGGPGQPRRPVRRAARDRQDLAGADPRQGRQLHRPPGRRRL